MVSFEQEGVGTTSGAPGNDSRIINVASNGYGTGWTTPSSQTVNLIISATGCVPYTNGAYGLQFSNSSTGNPLLTYSDPQSGITYYYTYVFSFVGIVPSTITNTGDLNDGSNFITFVNPNT